MGVPNAYINTAVTPTNMPLEPQNGELEGARDRVDHMLHARLSSSTQQSVAFELVVSGLLGLTCSKLGRMKETIKTAIPFLQVLRLIAMPSKIHGQRRSFAAGRVPYLVPDTCAA
jgi:hypothetical protein